jgi:rfaE bifunctional protein kinase chain/domain
MDDLSPTVRNSFAGRRIAIIGALVADQFLSGSISRVSREAPVFILKHEDTETRPGGAANTAANVASLGGVPVLVGVVGDDENGRALLQSLSEAGVSTELVTRQPDRRTTTKVRVLAGQSYSPKQQVIRIDYENPHALAAETRSQLLDNIGLAAENSDAILISDYGYGLIDDEIYARARELAGRSSVPIVVDSRFHLRELPGATAATPNQEEVERLIGRPFTDADCTRLCSELGYRALVVTCGNQGIAVFEQDKEPFRMTAIGPTVPVDVTGAGDTVIAAFSLGVAAGLSFREAAAVANHAGGIVVMKNRTATVSTDELLASLGDADSKAAASDAPA